MVQGANAEIEETPLSIFETTDAEFLGKAAHACRCQPTTVALEVTQLVFDKDFLVRPIDEFHVKNIKKLLQSNPNSFATPFLLEVVPEDCPTKDNWNLDPNVHSNWRYHLLGGNHGVLVVVPTIVPSFIKTRMQ